MSHWEHFHHQADIGVRGCGDSLESAFEQAGLALTAVITDPATVAAKQAVSIHCQAPDRELLFADWLNALIYEIATRKMLFSRFEVKINDCELNASAWGEPIELSRHKP
ncbi:MAG: archease, partial [Pseudomonadota bacterium]